MTTPKLPGDDAATTPTPRSEDKPVVVTRELPESFGFKVPPPRGDGFIIGTGKVRTRLPNARAGFSSYSLWLGPLNRGKTRRTKHANSNQNSCA
jgi:hypothetical protein